MNKTKKLTETIEIFLKKYKKPTYLKLIRYLLNKTSFRTRKFAKVSRE